MLKTKFKFLISISIGILISGCAGGQVDTKELAAMDAQQVIRTLALQRPIQLAWRARIIDSIQQINSPNFTAHQVHYVTASVADDGKDYQAAKFLKSYCEARDGIYPDKSFGVPNPQGPRTDCISILNGQLLFSVFALTSSKFPLTTGGSTNYNIVAIAVPKTTNNVNPAAELRVAFRDLPHNYLPRGTYGMPTLERK